MRKYCVTMGKPEEGSVNEDAVKATDKLIVVSDGAGGGGLFAERWSGYMLEQKMQGNWEGSPWISSMMKALSQHWLSYGKCRMTNVNG